MNPYPAYHPSGVKWLGDVPKHWGIARVTDMFEARSGGTPSTSENAYWEGSIPWVSAKDMKTIRITDTKDHISEKAVAESATSLVPKGAVLLVARSGILKHTLPVGLAEREVAINQDIKGLIPYPTSVDALYFVYWIHGLQSALLTMWRQQGATVESLDFNSVRSTAFPLPPLDEQRAIAAFLDRETERIDALVAKMRLLIERLQEYRTTLITHTVARGLPPEAARAVGLDPSPRLKPSGIEWLGDVPEHWEVKRLKYVTSYQTSSIDKKVEPEQIPVRLCNYTDVYYQDRIRVSQGNFMEATATRRETARFRLKLGDVLITKDSEDWQDIGIPALVEETADDFVCGYHLGFIRPRPVLHPSFLFRLMQSGAINQRLQTSASGVTRYGLPNRAVSDVSLLLPHLPEQRAIAAFLDRETERIDALVAKKRQLIERLQEYRIALITASVTGKVDVREPVATDGS